MSSEPGLPQDDWSWPPARMAKFLDLSPRGFYNHVASGVIPKMDRGRYNPILCTQAYIRFLRNRQPIADEGAQDYAKERARDKRFTAAIKEIELAKLRRELIPATLVKELWQGVVVSNRQVILQSDLSDHEKRQILDQLKDFDVEDYYKRA